MPIKKLYLEPTSRCNYHCRMCFRQGWIDEQLGDMSAETFSNVFSGINAMPSIETVFFGGMGEPLVHKDICGFVSAFSKIGKRTELLTNAALLDAAMTGSLLEAGLSGLWVSVDGFSEKSYQKVHGHGRFNTIEKNLDGFNKSRKNSGVFLGLTFVLQRDNIGELPLMNAFADRFAVDVVNISYEIPSRPTAPNDTLYAGSYPLGKMRRVPKIAVTRLKRRCPFIDDGAAFIRWDGNVAPCMQLLHSSWTYLYEQRRKVLHHSFGNINCRNLPEILNDAAYVAFRNRVASFDFPDCVQCDGCTYRESNQTDCLCNDAPTCGACLWAQGIAFCP